MPKIEDSIFLKYRKILGFMGVTIPDHYGKRGILIQIYYLGVIFTMSMNALCLFISIFTRGVPMSDRSISLVCFLMCGSAVFKLIILQTRSYELLYLFDALNTPGAARSTWVLRKTNTISSIYTTCIIILASGWCAYPFVVKKLKLPIPYWLPFVAKTVQQRMCVFMFVTSTMLFACGTHESTDTLLLMIAAQICRFQDVASIGIKYSVLINHTIRHWSYCAVSYYNQLPNELKNIEKRFDSVNETLQTLGEYQPLAKGNFGEEKVIERSAMGLMIVKDATMSRDETLLKECIREHVDVIKLVRHLDEVLDIIFFVQVIQSTLVSVMTFFAIFQVDSVYDEFPKFFTIIMATYLQFYMYCWFGEEISFHSDDLHKAVYISKWYKCNRRVMKSIVVMETFTKTHFKLEGGHLFQMGLHTFLLVLEQSFSYLMVLRAVTRKSNQMAFDAAEEVRLAALNI